nr:hypothetical protein [Sphingobium sp. YBL2]
MNWLTAIGHDCCNEVLATGQEGFKLVDGGHAQGEGGMLAIIPPKRFRRLSIDLEHDLPLSPSLKAAGSAEEFVGYKPEPDWRIATV